MTDLVITVNWEYFLGIVSGLIALAYYANGRFTRLETSVEWLIETVRGLKIDAENSALKCFDVKSPVSLTSAGRRLLQQSGLLVYLRNNKDQLAAQCRRMAGAQPYEFQRCAFRLFAHLPFDPELESRLRRLAFANGVSTDVLRRAAAIYLTEISSADPSADQTRSRSSAHRSQG